MTEKREPSVQASLNDYILQEIDTYPDDGSLQQLPAGMWNSSMGTTRDIHYMGQIQWEGDPQRRSYCSGLVFEIYLAACRRYAVSQSGRPAFILSGVDLNNFDRFRRDFYGVFGNERTLVDALVTRGLGTEIEDIDAALPGDLIQIWTHGGMGHAAVFLRWDRDSHDRPTKLHFWSVQADGVGADSFEVGSEGVYRINESRTFIVRPSPPDLPSRGHD
jgi:hypothetical protein